MLPPGKKGQSQFVFTAMVFYITLIVILTGLGATFGGAENIIEFPTLPDIPNPADEIPVVGAIFGFFVLVLIFVAWIALIISFLFQLIAFTFVDFVGFPLNVIIFLPITMFMIWEVIKLIRGTSS